MRLVVLSQLVDELVARGKVNLVRSRLRDDLLEDVDSLPAREVLAREIVENMTDRWRSSRR